MMWGCFLTFLFIGSVLGRVVVDDNRKTSTSLDIPTDFERSYLDSLKQHCLRNSDKEDYEKAKEGYDKYKQCVSDNKPEIEFSNVIRGSYVLSLEIRDVPKVIRGFCEKKAELQKCGDNLAESMYGCMNTSDPTTPTLQRSKKYLKDLGDYLCYNNGQRLADFMTDNSLTCIKGQYESIVRCPLPTNVSTSSKENCVSFSVFTNCLIRSISSCPQSTVDFVTGLRDVVFEECHDRLQAESNLISV